jgi:glutamate racemase
MKSGPIGIFDSGFGGLSIYQSIRRLLPLESMVYIGDHAYLPYGGRSRTEIVSRSKKLITFLLARHAKLIVVACNTATIAGIEQYRMWFPDIPIIGVVPVVKTAAEMSERNSFAVLSTAFTSKSSYQRDLIKKFAPSSRVYSLGCPNLLSFVEQGILSGNAIDTELRSLLTPKVIRSVDTVVLGCTHYPFLRDSIRAIVGSDMRILDSGGAVARHVQRILLHNGIRASGVGATHTFYSTGTSRRLSGVATTLLHTPVRVHHAIV